MTRQTSVSSPALLHWDGKYHGVAFIQVVGSALAVKLQETIRPKLTCEGDVDETTLAETEAPRPIFGVLGPCSIRGNVPRKEGGCMIPS
jgi:hypothetical protein